MCCAASTRGWWWRSCRRGGWGTRVGPAARRGPSLRVRVWWLIVNPAACTHEELCGHRIVLLLCAHAPQTRRRWVPDGGIASCMQQPANQPPELVREPAAERRAAPRRAAQPSPAPWLGLCGVAACGASRGDTPRPAAAESRFGCDLLTYVHAARRRVQPEQLGEVLCSFFLLASVTAAVFHRERTGEGQLVDLAQLRCACWLTNQVCRRRHQWPADGSRVASARVIE
jgi:hypothetical protein